MKNLTLIICCLALLAVASFSAKGHLSAPNEQPNDSIHVLSSPDLYEISTTWVEMYKQSYPEAKMDVVKASSEKISLALKNLGNIAIVSKAYYPKLDEQQNWSMIVGRDVIVPILNPENPYLAQIKQKGISPEAFAAVFTNPTKQNWGTILNNQVSNSVKCYLTNTEKAKWFLADFISTSEQKLVGAEFVDDEQLILKLRNDKYAIGFCKLSAIIDNKSNELLNGIALIPIDANGNQKLDNFENIYNSAAELTRGLWIGKYPNELYSRIYTVTAVPPTQKTELAFLNWILDGGQPFLSAKGLKEITSIEQKRRIQNLFANQDQFSESKPQTSIVTIFLILLVLGLAILLITYSIFSYRNYKKQQVANNLQDKPTIFGEHTVEVLKGLFFDKTHTWAFMDRNGGIRIGVDDFLQHVTGTITKIKMKAPGEFIKKGEPFITLIQQGKQLEINAPVSGVIKENNANLLSKASLINSSPYGEGWIYVIESDNWLKEIKLFLMGDSYKIWINYEFERLKTFLSIVINNKQIHQNQLVMQDGGELKDNILESFGPEVWEEFQIKFINHSS